MHAYTHADMHTYIHSYIVEMYMRMGNAGFPSLLWDFHENGDQLV